MMDNHFTESEKLLFSALSLLVHFRESLYRISVEQLLYEKLFSRAPAEFITESARRALPKEACSTNRIVLQ
jgi:hypothetical protein